MIKKLVFLAALLVPALAYGQTPSSTLTVQVEPSGSIPCGIGPNYNGAIPAGAQAAGFTTCAANYDFTQPSYATLSNWFQCPDTGASGSQWYTGDNGIPCSDIQMVTDGGVQVLQLSWGAAEMNSGHGLTQINSTSNQGFPNPPGGKFPLGSYVEAVLKTDTMPSQCPNTPNCYMADLYYFPPYNSGTTPNINQTLEIDFIEYFGNGTGGTALDWNNHHYFSVGAQATFSNMLGWNPNTYNTVGNRTTINSTTIATCWTLNGTYLGNQTCTSYNYSNSNSLNNRNRLLLWDGAQCAPASACGGTPTGTFTFKIKRITVWSCANWQTQPCSGTILTGPP